MAFDPVPWAIGGGAEHTDDLWRVAANAFTRDSEGIVLPGDMKVTSGGAGVVNIAAGAVILRNRQKPGQSYVGAAYDPTAFPYPSNAGGGSTVRHLVVARVIDPQFSPWQPSGTPGAPNTSVQTGPYFEPFLVPGVASGVTRASSVVTYSAEALARIDVPAGATTGTITDCRRLAQPRTGFAFDVQKVNADDSILLGDTTYTDFTTNSLALYVPRWATHAQVGIDYLSILAGDAGGAFRAVLGGAVGPDVLFDNESTAEEKVPFSVYGEFNVQAAQDSTITLKVQGKRFGTSAGVLRVTTNTLVRYDVKFSERVV